MVLLLYWAATVASGRQKVQPNCHPLKYSQHIFITQRTGREYALSTLHSNVCVKLKDGKYHDRFKLSSSYNAPRSYCQLSHLSTLLLPCIEAAETRSRNTATQHLTFQSCLILSCRWSTCYGIFSLPNTPTSISLAQRKWSKLKAGEGIRIYDRRHHSGTRRRRYLFC